MPVGLTLRKQITLPILDKQSLSSFRARRLGTMLQCLFETTQDRRNNLVKKKNSFFQIHSMIGLIDFDRIQILTYMSLKHSGSSQASL